MSVHTAEPWRVEEHLAHLSFPGGIGIYGKDRSSASVLSHPALDDQEQTADFRRIVACVNACAGISDAFLTEYKGGIAAALAASKERLQQRDELTGALRELVACKDLKERIIERGDPHGRLNAEYRQRQPRAWLEARALLSEVKP